MARLPVAGNDNGTWGDLLNSFLSVGHNGDGTLKGIGSNTLTIAANDSSARGKNVADYVCSGSGDGSTISTAIAALPAGGGILQFCEGTYTVNAASITLRSNIHLRGTGGGTVIKLANSANGRLIDSTTTFNDITFEGIVFDCNGTNQTDGAARDDRSGLYLQNITGFRLINCTVKNCRHGAGARIASMSNVYYIGNKFQDNGVTGAAFICDHSYCGDTTYYQVIGNYYNNASDTGTAQDGVTYSTVVGNVYVNNILGVSVSASPTAASKYNTVANNIIEGQGATADSSGIKVSKFGSAEGTQIAEVTLSGNVIRNCDRTLWIDQVDRITVANNILADAAGNNKQLVIIGTVGTVNDITFTGNTFYNTTNRGISFDVGGTTVNPTVTNNQFITVTTPIGGSVPASAVIRQNRGFVTEASGITAVLSGTTSISVTHGLGLTPAAGNVSVTPTNNLGTAAKFWISAVGATTFTVNTDINPGVSTATFAWRAAIY